MYIPSSVVLGNVRFIDPRNSIDQIADVLIVEGKLKSINTQELPGEIDYLNCENLLLAPALVDLYSILSQPGHEERETLSSLLCAARAGGIGQLNLYSKVLNEPASFVHLDELLKTEGSSIEVNFWACANNNQQLNNLLELSQSRIIGFIYNNPIEDYALARSILEYLAPIGLPLALTPLDRALAGKGVMREGVQALRLGLSGVPSYCETASLAGILQMVEEIGTPVHFMRISTAKSIELIAQAKRKGLPITASTTWLHLLFTSEDIASYNPNLRLEPPLGNPGDRHALVEAIKTGIVDAIAIDHTPYTYEEKTVAFAEAPTGAIGLEIALALLYQKLVLTEELSPLELWAALTLKPIHSLGRSPNNHWILFDPNQQWKVEPSSLNSLSHNTHYLGEQVSGKVIGSFYNFRP